MSTATSAEEAQGVEPVAEVVPCYTPSGKRVALNTEYQSLPIGTKLFTRPAPPANTELLAGKLELMTAERDKLQLELGDLRALRARRPAHDNPTQIGGPGDWAIAGIEVKIGDGGPNFHLYRLLGSNELEPGVYELFARPAKPPTGERAALIQRLQEIAGFSHIYENDRRTVREAADMLAADAQEIERKYISPVRTVADLANNLLLIDHHMDSSGFSLGRLEN